MDRRRALIVDGLWALALGAVAFHVLLGLSIVAPGNVHWLEADDPGIHLLGWEFFRRDAWHFPLARMATLLAPYGATIIQTDSIPWLGVALKTMRSALPEAFQYFGAWLFSCYVLQAFFALRLAARFTARQPAKVVFAILLVTCPVLVGRFGHNSLCAQWIFLFFLGIVAGWLEAPPRVETFPWLALLALNVFLVGVHVYLATMSIALTAALFLGARGRQPRTEDDRRLLFRFATILFAMGASALALGYFSISDPRAEPSSEYRADLLSLVSPGLRSSLFPPLFPWGIENFAYLGLGLILIVAALVACLATPATRKRLAAALYRREMLPFLVVTGLFFLYSLSPQISIAQRPVLGLSRLYVLLGPIPLIFRSMGRFLWPFYYLLVVTALVAPLILLDGKRALAVLCVAFALQLLDLGAWYVGRAERLGTRSVPTLSPFEPPPGTRALLLVPPRLQTADCYAVPGFDDREYLRFGFFAARHGLAYNSGFMARPPVAALGEPCRALVDEITRARLRPGNLYLLHKSLAGKIGSASGEGKEKLGCRTWDGYVACAAGGPW